MKGNRKSVKRNHNEVHIVRDPISRALEDGDPANKMRVKYGKPIETTGSKKNKINKLQKT